MSAISTFFRVSVLASFLSASMIIPSFADPLQRGLQGAIGGALLGGIISGGKGMGRGAAIGGAVGIIGGAMEEDRRRDRYYEERYVYIMDEPASSKPLVRRIQGALNRLGYRPGPVDGMMGRQTSAAISRYQDEYGLLITGQASPALLSHMKRNGG
ncbi:MAG: peptidoglycan-binding domain-containing protein [Methyloligellaceae bacterium]